MFEHASGQARRPLELRIRLYKLSNIVKIGLKGSGEGV
jgi:hypothetical protein